MSLIQLAVLAIVALVLGLFVLRPILKGQNTTDLVERRSPRMSQDFAEQEGGFNGLIPLNGEISNGAFEFTPLPASISAAGDTDPGPQISTDPVERLRALISERQDETVEILRGWLEDRGEKV